MMIDEEYDHLSPKSEASDGSIAFSQYSSCLESEYDRYRSANSAMGTPSLCSSVGVFDLDLDQESFRGLDDCDSEYYSKKIRIGNESKITSSSKFNCLDDHNDEYYDRKISVNDVVGRGDQSLNRNDTVTAENAMDVNNFTLVDDNTDLETGCVSHEFNGCSQENGARCRNLDDEDSMHIRISEENDCNGHGIIKGEPDTMICSDPLSFGLEDIDGDHTQLDDLIAQHEGHIQESHAVGMCMPQVDPLAQLTAHHAHDSTAELGILNEHSGSGGVKFNPIAIVGISNDNPPVTEATDGELGRIYDEVVYEMEEILLDTDKSLRNRASLDSRDGGATASTSEQSHGSLGSQHSLRIVNVEVVGAKQRKGNVSLSEKLVGVKEYTVYVIRVRSRETFWDIECRYREFCSLYHQLKTYCSDQGRPLPAPWFCVERESRKIFGNTSSDVVSERSALIQDCLQSIVHSRHLSPLPSFLIYFLSPKNVIFDRGSSGRNLITPPGSSGKNLILNPGSGKVIGLIIDDQPNRSSIQILESQNYSCGGCGKRFHDGKTWIWELVEVFGLAEHRFCKYTGQLFCLSCHVNDSAILPAMVLHHWDFRKYPVSKTAKAFLDSMHNQPILCLGAVNPFLFSKVPALHQVSDRRKKIAEMVPYVRCPFRRSIQKGLGSRRYLIENIDFFALKDLIDLSKGAFAALPVMVDIVYKRIREHIMDQCLVCCDVGIPCGARNACDDPPSLIFPFQDDDVDKCGSCHTAFHKRCFARLGKCYCVSEEVDRDVVSSFPFPGMKPGPGTPLKFLSGLFSRNGQGARWGSGSPNNAILMDSLPNTSM